jgi:hypothetical protein
MEKFPGMASQRFAVRNTPIRQAIREQQRPVE